MSLQRILIACLLTLPVFAATLHVTADTNSNLSIPMQVNGTATSTFVRNSGVPGERRTCLPFDVSPVPGAVLVRATLRVFVAAVTDAGPDLIRPVSAAWDESSLSASNAPPLGATVATMNVATSDLPRYVTADIACLVQGWVNGTIPNFGIALLPTTPNTVNITLETKENTSTNHGPELEIVPSGPQGAVGPAGPVGLVRPPRPSRPPGAGAGGGRLQVDTCTSSGVWVKPAGAHRTFVIVLSTGGAGGGPICGACGAGGGGGGGYAERWISGGLPAIVVVTVGSGGVGYSGAPGTNGGTSSFGSFVTATGGRGWGVTEGGIVGEGVTGDLKLSGQRGGYGGASTTAAGGDALLGYGFGGRLVAKTGPPGYTGNHGFAGQNYGAGGSGAYSAWPYLQEGAPGLVISTRIHDSVMREPTSAGERQTAITIAMNSHTTTGRLRRVLTLVRLITRGSTPETRKHQVFKARIREPEARLI